MQGKRIPAEMAPLAIREYLTDVRSIRSRVVLEKMRPPKPEPAFASPYAYSVRCRKYMSSHERHLLAPDSVFDQTIVPTAAAKGLESIPHKG